MVCKCNNNVISMDMVVRSNELIPEYATELDGCLDLKVDLGENAKSYTSLAVPAGHTLVVDTGIQVKVPKDHVMLIFPRSSTGLKLHCMLANTVGVIDAGYRDEVKLLIHNYGERAVYLTHAQKVAQFMVIPRPKVQVVLVEDNDNFREGDRGGGLGSTGL